MTDEAMHYSGLTLHRKCPQAWTYNYLRRLRPLSGEVAPVRDMGSWWHALRAADSLTRGRSSGSLQSVPRKITTTDDGPTFRGRTVTVEEVLSSASQWWERLPGDLRDEYVSQIGQGPPQRLQSMLTRWRDRWEKEREHETVLAVEMFWRRDLRTLSGGSLPLFGFIDEVYLDTARDLVVVRDIKTSRGSLDTQTAADNMMDSQLHLYAWGAAPVIEGWGQGKVKALSYDRIRSGAPLTPEVTLSGNLSKSVTGYDLETYLEWATGPDGEGVPWGKEGEYFKTGKRAGEPKFGRYQMEPEVAERLATPAARSAWYQRTLTPLNVHLVREHLRSAMDTADDSQRTRQRFEETGAAARNLSKGNCRWCDFAKLCRAEMVGGPRGDYDLEDFGLRRKP